MSKIIGLDLGSKRIGIAICDVLGIIAQPLKTLENQKEEEIVKELEELIKNEDIKEIVVGLPLNMDGSQGPQAKNAIEFSRLLKEELDIPIKLWDERMTTIEVERILIKADISRKKRRRKIDGLSAQVMLQGYLNSIKNVP